MGLVHTSSVELGRYRALASECNEVYSLNGKKCLYLDFDGKELGLANRLLNGAVTTIHARNVSIFDQCKSAFSGKRHVSLKVYPRLDLELIGESKYDVLVWWKGPQTDDDFKFLNSFKGLFRELVIVGADWQTMSRPEMSSFHLTEFLGSGLAFERMGVETKTTPKPVAVSRQVKEVNPPKAEEPEPSAKKKSVKRTRKVSKGNLTGRDVTTGEMKTEQTPVPTNISSKSAAVQDPAKPPVKKSTKKPSLTADGFIKKSSKKVKIETAFLLSGELPESVEEAEAVIRSASPEDLSVVC
jgi:hypothetical protein